MKCINSPSGKPLFARLMGMIGRAMSKAITDGIREAGYDLNMEEWIVLVHLWEQDGQNHAKLGKFAGRHKTAVTRAIDHLEELNYVLRVPDQTDRRNKLIYLTKAGKELEGILKPMAEKIHTEALNGISEQEIIALQTTLHKIHVNTRHHI